MVIDQEHLLMAQMLRMLQQEGVPPRAFRELRVDSILLQAGVKKHATHVKEKHETHF